MKELSINVENFTYKIIIKDNLLDNLSFYVSNVYKNKKVYIITDENVAKFYLKQVINSLNETYQVDYVIIKSGESFKSLETISSICKQLIDKNIKRNDLIISLGGGVVSDISGFVASILYRGVPYINISTSLLSDVDASIGGKTGIDFANHKNILGTFKQPLVVLIDPLTLNTLPQEEIENGIGEIIKHGAIGNIELLKKLEKGIQINEDIIYESLKVKKYFVEKDVFDQKERMLLNFGHTFGHIIELKENLKHGMAVGIGMLMAIEFGISLKITNPNCYKIIKDILEKYHLPTTKYNYQDYLEDVCYDKKNLSGTINFILLKDLGEAIIYPIEEKLLIKK